MGISNIQGVQNERAEGLGSYSSHMGHSTLVSDLAHWSIFLWHPWPTISATSLSSLARGGRRRRTPASESPRQAGEGESYIDIALHFTALSEGLAHIRDQFWNAWEKSFHMSYVGVKFINIGRGMTRYVKQFGKEHRFGTDRPFLQGYSGFVAILTPPLSLL